MDPPLQTPLTRTYARQPPRLESISELYFRQEVESGLLHEVGKDEGRPKTAGKLAGIREVEEGSARR